SCNSAYNGIYGSATLSLIIDRNTLTTIYNNPFIELYGEGERPYEYGIDAFQSDDGIYVVSNNFLPFPNLGYGFNVDARRTSITYVDNSLNTFSNSRIKFLPSGGIDTVLDWGARVLASSNNDQGFVLAGLRIGWNGNYCNLSGNPSPSFDTIVPYLTEIDPTWNGSNISITTNFWKIYFNQSGTGSFSSGAVNNFYDLGGGLSNI